MLKGAGLELWKDLLGKPSCRFRHTMRHLYRPVSAVEDSKRPLPKTSDPNKATLSRSQKLMADLGLVHASSTTGAFHLLPVAAKSMDKLTRTVDRFMGKIGGQKIQMPSLTSTSLWKQTGRLDDCKPELMTVTDRHSREYILSPTHEEAVCDLVNGHPLTFKQLPLRLYQITGKFRDEMKPRFGLLRGREFIMKDLYTFDKDEQSSKETYEEVSNIYSELFDYIGVKWIKARGSSGTIGGDVSHEFHLISDIGEDQVLVCEDCTETFNEELISQAVEDVKVKQNNSSISVSTGHHALSCPKCGSQKLTTSPAIEVGHTFLLGTKYTKALNTTFMNSKGKAQHLEMGCYGLGVSRILASVIEVLSKPDEIRWPLPLAPYMIAIIPPKAGSKEEVLGTEVTSKLYSKLNEILPNDILLDDRTEFTIGRRLKDIKMLGVPYIIVLGKGLAETPGLVEFHDLNSGAVLQLDKDGIFDHCNSLRINWNLL